MDSINNRGQILNMCKPIGWTSNDVVRWVKRRTGEKVGHAGTLDPFADGVLLMCIGAATKKVPQLMALEKEYRALVEFGVETDTLDIAGTIINQRPIRVESAILEQSLASFIGDIDQTPPLYSALKVQGRRAYDLARSGKPVQLDKRLVHIYDISVVQFNGRQLEIDVRCAKGVYIRSLARDIAQHCGTIGFLRKLTRTRVGHYKVRDSIRIDQADNLKIV